MQTWRGLWVGSLALGAACMLALNAGASEQQSARKAELINWAYVTRIRAGQKTRSRGKAPRTRRPLMKPRDFSPIAGVPNRLLPAWMKSSGLIVS
jgi:hypothetical protein